MLATGMPIAQAVGASLIGVAALEAATAASHAASGLVDWSIADQFLVGGRLPEPEDDGRRYLKIPLDALAGAAWDD